MIELDPQLEVTLAARITKYNDADEPISRHDYTNGFIETARRDKYFADSLMHCHLDTKPDSIFYKDTGLLVGNGSVGAPIRLYTKSARNIEAIDVAGSGPGTIVIPELGYEFTCVTVVEGEYYELIGNHPTYLYDSVHYIHVNDVPSHYNTLSGTYELISAETVASDDPSLLEELFVNGSLFKLVNIDTIGRGVYLEDGGEQRSIINSGGGRWSIISATTNDYVYTDSPFPPKKGWSNPSIVVEHSNTNIDDYGYPDEFILYKVSHKVTPNILHDEYVAKVMFGADANKLYGVIGIDMSVQKSTSYLIVEGILKIKPPTTATMSSDILPGLEMTATYTPNILSDKSALFSGYDNLTVVPPVVDNSIFEYCTDDVRELTPKLAIITTRNSDGLDLSLMDSVSINDQSIPKLTIDGTGVDNAIVHAKVTPNSVTNGVTIISGTINTNSNKLVLRLTFFGEDAIVISDNSESTELLETGAVLELPTIAMGYTKVLAHIVDGTTSYICLSKQNDLAYMIIKLDHSNDPNADIVFTGFDSTKVSYKVLDMQHIGESLIVVADDGVYAVDKSSFASRLLISLDMTHGLIDVDNGKIIVNSENSINVLTLEGGSYSEMTCINDSSTNLLVTNLVSIKKDKSGYVYLTVLDGTSTMVRVCVVNKYGIAEVTVFTDVPFTDLIPLYSGSILGSNSQGYNIVQQQLVEDTDTDMSDTDVVQDGGGWYSFEDGWLVSISTNFIQVHNVFDFKVETIDLDTIEYTSEYENNTLGQYSIFNSGEKTLLDTSAYLHGFVILDDDVDLDTATIMCRLTLSNPIPAFGITLKNFGIKSTIAQTNIHRRVL